MYHYTYMIKLKAPTDARYLYIGVRSTKCKPEEDKYLGSSKPLSRWIASNGPGSVEKIILCQWPDREQALSHEVLLHDCFDVGRNSAFWNQAKQKSTGFDTFGVPLSDELKTLKSLKTRGVPKSEDHKRKIAQSNFGKPKSEAHRKKLSESRLGKPSPMRGVPVGVGRPKSLEHRVKIGLANTGKQRSPETRALYSAIRKGKPQVYSPTRYSKVECPHCHKTGMKANMTRYHFDNCKEVAA